MSDRLHRIRSFVLAACALLASGNASANPPAEAFGRLPLISDPRLSPDGKWLAVIRPVDGVPAAVVFPVASNTKDKIKVLEQPGWQAAFLQWANDKRLLVTLKSPGGTRRNLRTWYRTTSMSITGGPNVLMFGGSNDLAFNVRIPIIPNTADDRTDAVYMPFWDGSYSLFRVSTDTGGAQLAASGEVSTVQWIMDGYGHPIGRIDAWKLKDEFVYANIGDDWTKIATLNFQRDSPVLSEGMTEDGKAMVFVASNASGQRGLMRLDLKEGTTPEPLYFDSQYDAVNALTDERTGRVIGVAVTADSPQDRYFDSAHAALQANIDAAFPNLYAHLTSTDAANDAAIVAVEAPKTPPTFFYFNPATHKKIEIGSAYPELKESDLGEERPYPYAARDGLRIPAYLTLPPGKAPSRLPVVVLPHGGPSARDAIQFDWLAQFLANRGYAVLQPNFRGSTGYGDAFENAGLQQWGLKMEDDITDGVQKLIADGIADPKRICIAGESYGGFSALVGAFRYPELYACAASISGVSDLDHMFEGEVHNAGTAAVKFGWRDHLGIDPYDSDKMDAVSAALHVDSIRCPILLMHSENDTTVPIAQSEEMRDALLKAKKPVTYVQFDGDDHYMTLAASRIQMLTELEKFLKANIGN